MRVPRWLEREALLLLHAESLARFGDGEGIRDEALLESALARPQNIRGHKPEADILALAAAYAFGIARNHPFIDGNRRAAFLSAGIFLELNGWRLQALPADAVAAVTALAASTIGEDEFAAWLRANAISQG